MSTLKIVDFRLRGLGLFASYLSWLSERQGWGWSVQHEPQFSWDLLEGYDAAFVDPTLSTDVLAQVRTLPTQVRNVGCLDSFFFSEGAWYPRLITYEALRQVLVAEARDLDMRAPAFVVGQDESLRIVASVLAELGFVDIFLVGAVDALEAQKSVLSRSHIGISFHIMDSEDLTLQAVSAAIIVNTFDLSERKDLLTNLSYFNFMKSSGYVMDLSLGAKESVFLEEAHRAHLRTLDAVLVAAAMTRLWFERMNALDLLKSLDLQKTWREFLEERKPTS